MVLIRVWFNIMIMSMSIWFCTSRTYVQLIGIGWVEAVLVCKNWKSHSMFREIRFKVELKSKRMVKQRERKENKIVFIPTNIHFANRIRLELPVYTQSFTLDAIAKTKATVLLQANLHSFCALFIWTLVFYLMKTHAESERRYLVVLRPRMELQGKGQAAQRCTRTV